MQQQQPSGVFKCTQILNSLTSTDKISPHHYLFKTYAYKPGTSVAPHVEIHDYMMKKRTVYYLNLRISQ